MLSVFSGKKKDEKKSISLDFDGVIHSYTNGWTGETPEDSPVSGSLDFVKELIDMGYEVVVHSARAQTKGGKEGIRKWLNEHKFPDIEVSLEKPHAELYVDDRGFRFEGKFEKVLNFINGKSSLKPWYKK